MFPIWSDINLCFGLLLSIMISLASGFAIFALEIRIRMTGWFFIISCRLIAMSRRLSYRNCLEHSKLMQTPIFVLFSETQISSHLFEISLKLTIICYINLIKSTTIIKNGWINISCTVIFLRMSQVSGINLSDHLILRIFLISFWTQAYQHEILSRHLEPHPDKAPQTP